MATTVLTPQQMCTMFLAGAKELEAHKDHINELNVFPVPDGDTGMNMTLTIMSAAKEVYALKDPNMQELDVKFAQIQNALKDNNLNYVEDVRNIVNSIKAQIDGNISQITSNSEHNYSGINAAIGESREIIQKNIQAMIQ